MICGDTLSVLLGHVYLLSFEPIVSNGRYEAVTGHDNEAGIRCPNGFSSHQNIVGPVTVSPQIMDAPRWSLVETK